MQLTRFVPRYTFHVSRARCIATIAVTETLGVSIASNKNRQGPPFAPSGCNLYTWSCIRSYNWRIREM